VAVTSAVAKSTDTARPLGAFRLTVKLAITVPKLPSVTVTSLTENEGRGSLSLIVPRPCPSAIVAFVGFVRLTKKVSFDSSSRSPLTSTVTCFEVWPAAKVSVPEPAA
jgi:hypothetical protein